MTMALWVTLVVDATAAKAFPEIVYASMDRS